MRRLSAPGVIGLALLAGAATAAAGWFAQVPALVRFMPGAAMVLNTALLLGVLGLALWSEELAPEPRRRLQTVAGAALALIAGLILAEHVAGGDLGIDWRALHAWYRDDNPHPGRTSAPTAFAFLLSGATLLLMHRVRGLWGGMVVQALTTAVVVVGAAGIVSYLLELPLVYESYPFRQMALMTAVSLVLAGAGLWLCWRRHAWYAERNVIENEAQRISLNSVIVLASIVCASMLAGLLIVQHQVEALARDTLLWPLESRVSLFRINLEQRAVRATMVGNAPEIATLMRRLGERPADRDALARLREAAETYLPFGFVGIAFLDTGDKEWVRVGHLSERPALALALDPAPPANTLMWSEESFVLQTRVPLLSGAERVGTLIAEQRLTALGAAMDRAYEFAATGDIAVCGRLQERLACFPQRYVPGAFALPYDAALPVARALANESGVAITRDERSNNVIAAYGPIGSTGLGMVVRMHTAELYAPLREALVFSVGLAMVLVAGGALLLYWRVSPLVHKLYLGDQRLRLALDSSRSAWWDWDLRNGTVQLSEHWQAMLGQPARATVIRMEELATLVHPEDRPLVERRLRVALKSRDAHYDVEHRVLRPDGRWMWISSAGKVVERDGREQAVRMIGINADISPRKEASLKVEYQAKHDMLTHLPNRATFYDRLALAMSRTLRNKTLMAVMYLDVDRFKAVNDAFGHAVGDLLLKDFAQRLAYCVRAIDTVARVGGDEFAVILEDIAQREDGCRIAGKIVREMEPEFPLDEHTVSITTSAGIAFYDGTQPLGADRLVAAADLALYEAKNSGRNSYQVAA